MNITEFSRFAIIQTAFIGDVALTLPVADAIKSVHPSAEIHFITTPIASSLAESTDSIDYVHVFDKRGKHKSLRGILSFAESLSSKSIECVLSPHRSLRTTLISKLIKPKYSIGFTVNALSWLYSKRVEYPIHIHEVERNLRLLSVFDETNKLWLQKAPRPQVTISHGDTQEVLKLLDREFSHKPSSIIALAPGSVWNTKRWIEDNFIKTAIELHKKGHSCVFVGGVEDIELCSRLAQNSKAISLAGETSLLQTIALLRLCSALITNDSAPTHLAWIAGCRTITIYGPTSPIFGFAPRGENDIILENTFLKCRPCAIHGGNVCPIGTHECMKSITPLMATRTISATG